MDSTKRTLDEVAPLFGCAVVMGSYVLGAAALLHDVAAWAAVAFR